MPERHFRMADHPGVGRRSIYTYGVREDLRVSPLVSDMRVFCRVARPRPRAIPSR
jgi:hypothetical protein